MYLHWIAPSHVLYIGESCKGIDSWHSYSRHYAESVISLACFEMQKKKL